MNRSSWLGVFLLVVVPLGPVGAYQEPATDHAKLLLKRRDAARKTYELTWANYRDVRVPGEPVYRWSLRWLEAEKQWSDRQDDQVAAYLGHLERMRDLERLVIKQQPSGQITLDELSSAEYYRVEAELWLAQAKEKR